MSFMVSRPGFISEDESLYIYSIPVVTSERRVRVERLVTHCDEFMTKAFSKNEQLFELTKKTNDPASTSADLEKWLHETTVNNDKF